MRFTRELLDTLLSSFDSKETLLKWLKKLERAINDANVSFVESVVIESNPVGDAFRVGIIFAGGDSIYSNYFKIEDTFLTQAQIDALNSGITASKVSEFNNKQDALSQSQLDAVNSGINASKVAEIDNNTEAIVNLDNNKQDNLSEAQLNAVNSGITASKVSEFNNKQDALSQSQLDAVNSGINANKVAEIDNKVTKTVTTKQLYGTNDNGEQTTVPYGTDATQFSIVQRGGLGAIYVPTTPNLPNDAPSKKYVDDADRNLQSQLTPRDNTSGTMNSQYVTQGICTIQQVGKIVCVKVDGMKVNTSTPTHEGLLISGLPKPKDFFTAIMFPSMNNTFLRTQLVQNGSEGIIRTHYTSNSAFGNNEIVCTFVYIAE